MEQTEKSIESVYLKRRSRLPLWMEITLVLVLKIAMLYAIWITCFSDPISKHMHVDDAHMNAHMLSQVNQSDSGRSEVPQKRQ